METDPLYADPANWIFDYPANSPAVNAGMLDLSTLGIEDLTSLVDQSPDTGAPDLGFHHMPDGFYANPPFYMENEISVFPNPAGEIVCFEIQLKNLKFKFLPSVSIFNLIGQKVVKISANQNNKLNYYKIEWRPGDTVASGIYFAVFSGNIKKGVSKLIIIK